MLKIQDLKNDTFTLQLVDFLLSTFDPMESGINWKCDKSLNNQQQTFFSHSLNDKICYLFGRINRKFTNIFSQNILWINRGLYLAQF